MCNRVLFVDFSGALASAQFGAPSMALL